jgi:hypothetical protein
MKPRINVTVPSVPTSSNPLIHNKQSSANETSAQKPSLPAPIISIHSSGRVEYLNPLERLRRKEIEERRDEERRAFEDQ